MRLFGRGDLLSAAALAAALVVVFTAPMSRLLDSIRTIEDEYGFQLLPALVILAFAFVLQQLWKRQELRARSLASEIAAAEASGRATDMSRLVSFGQELARSLEASAIRRAAAAHLPLLVPARRSWITLHDGAWRIDCGGDGEGTATMRREPDAPPHVSQGDVCFPIRVADEELGLLGVAADPALTPHQRSMLAGAAALLAVTLKNAALLDAVRQNSIRDALTGCYTRAHSLEVLGSELRRADRAGGDVSVVMFDLDRFKSINDTYGHLCGDAVLAAVGARMRAVLRGGDLKCRYGGEEFLLVLVDTPLAGARHVAESLRRDLEAHDVRSHDVTLTVTASFGVTEAGPGELDPLALVARADEALYRAKQQGRNRVCAADPCPSRDPAAATEALDDRGQVTIA